MLKKLFAAVPLFSSAFAIRVVSDGDSTNPTGQTWEQAPISTGDFPDADPPVAPDVPEVTLPDATQPEQAESVDIQLHVYEINGDPADDWFSIDAMVNRTENTTNTTDDRPGGHCNNVGVRSWTYLNADEADDVQSYEFCMDDCINAGGAIETKTNDYDGYSETFDECVIDRDSCG